MSRTFDVTPAPAVVLDYLKDFANAEEWDPGTQRCVQSAPGPVAVGTTWHNASKLYFIRTELEYRLDRLEPDRVTFVGTNTTATSTDDIAVRAEGAGSRVTYTADVEFNGLAKLGAPLMQLLFSRLAGDTETSLRDALNRLGTDARP